MLKPGLAILTLLLAGCDSTTPPSPQTPAQIPAQTPTEKAAAPIQPVADPAHNARNSQDWAGTYQGMLPCADCEAINTILLLYRDGRYQLRQIYVGKLAQEFVQQGMISWNSAGDTLQLDDKQPLKFFVGENQLFMLDQQGQRIEGDLAARYLLQKQQDKL